MFELIIFELLKINELRKAFKSFNFLSCTEIDDGRCVIRVSLG